MAAAKRRPLCWRRCAALASFTAGSPGTRSASAPAAARGEVTAPRTHAASGGTTRIRSPRPRRAAWSPPAPGSVLPRRMRPARSVRREGRDFDVERRTSDTPGKPPEAAPTGAASRTPRSPRWPCISAPHPPKRCPTPACASRRRRGGTAWATGESRAPGAATHRPRSRTSAQRGGQLRRSASRRRRTCPRRAEPRHAVGRPSDIGRPSSRRQAYEATRGLTGARNRRKMKVKKPTASGLLGC